MTLKLSPSSKPKKKSSGPVQSMDEARLAGLEEWITKKVLPLPANGWVGKGNFAEFADFPRIMDLARAGLLNEGKRLARISLLLQTEEQREKLDFASCRLNLPKIRVKAVGENSGH